MCGPSPQASTQTDAMKLPAPPSRMLKNKALMCKPLIQEQGVQCKLDSPASDGHASAADDIHALLSMSQKGANIPSKCQGCGYCSGNDSLDFVFEVIGRGFSLGLFKQLNRAVCFTALVSFAEGLRQPILRLKCVHKQGFQAVLAGFED